MNVLVHCFDKLSALSVQSLDNDQLKARVAAIINSLDSARIQHGGNVYDVHVARRNLLELIRLKRPVTPPVASAPAWPLWCTGRVPPRRHRPKPQDPCELSMAATAEHAGRLPRLSVGSVKCQS